MIGFSIELLASGYMTLSLSAKGEYRERQEADHLNGKLHRSIQVVIRITKAPEHAVSLFFSIQLLFLKKGPFDVAGTRVEIHFRH